MKTVNEREVIMYRALHNSLKFLIVMLLLFANSFVDPSLSEDSKTSSEDKRTVVEKIRAFIKESSNITGRKRSESDKLKFSLLALEDRVIVRLRDADVSSEIIDIECILACLKRDDQKDDFLVSWRRRNKCALDLLQHWREHPEEISDMPALMFPEKAKRTTDRKLYNILSENEDTLIQYMETPVAETNTLQFFLIDPAVYPKAKLNGESNAPPPMLE
jgi:hypothetical protein